MRNILLTSTAAVCLLLAGQAANAQSEHQKKDEVKKEQVQQHEQQRDRQAQQHQERRSTTGQSAEEKKNEPSKADTKKSDTNKDAASSSEKKDQNTASKPSSESNKSAESEKSKRDESKKSAAEQKQNASPSKSTASEQNKANEAAKPSSAQAPAATQNKNAATPSDKTNATNNTTNNTNVNASTKNTNVNAQIDPQQKVKISETISKHHDLAAPVRNLNISITVGERVPSRIHLHSLPREIVTIAPEYRDYEYFTTEEDVVIVSPRTHEIVAQIPRDASRARAEVSGGSSTAMSGSSGGSGSMPCQVMERTASGDMKPVDASQLRQTTGSGGSNDRLGVKVQAPNGQQMPEVTLPDRQGRIIAETDGSGCKITIEPGQTGR